MLDIQIHTIVSRSVPNLLQAMPVFGVNSVEYQIECGVRFSCEAQNSVGLVRPNEFAGVHLPSKSPRTAQPLRLCQILPSSLQIGLRSFQIFIRFFKCGCSLSVPILRTLTRFGEEFSISAPATQ